MPQFTNYSDIIVQLWCIMQTATLYEYVQKPNQSSLVGSEVTNPLPTGVSAMDLIGLTWILLDKEDTY